MKKIISILLIGMFLLTGCSSDLAGSSGLTGSTSKPRKDYLSILNNAKQIVIDESAFSWGKSYDIKVNGEEVASVDGEVIKVWGDTFTLTDGNGDFVAKESEVKNFGQITRAAVMQDQNNNTIGYFGETLFSKLLNVGHTFYFYDKNQNQIGISDQVIFSMVRQYNFYDSNENVAYNVTESPFSWGDEYTLTVNNSSTIPVINAILMVCINDAISDSDQHKKASVHSANDYHGYSSSHVIIVHSSSSKSSTSTSTTKPSTNTTTTKPSTSTTTTKPSTSTSKSASSGFKSGSFSSTSKTKK